jgi:predicted RNA-binding protein YlxR (DUF448 family)
MMTATEHDKDGARPGDRSARTCAGCGGRDAADAVLRVVLDPSSGEVAVDLAGSGFGRGAHVHASAACVEKACKSGFSRSFKTKVTADPGRVGEQIVLQADRRIEGLLGGAVRARQVAVGSDVVVEALREGRAELVVVAVDAAAAAQLGEVRRAVGEGRAIAWGIKGRGSKDGPRKGLGSIFGRDEVGVVAVLHAGVADAIRRAHVAARPFRSEAWWSPEVR